MTRNIAGSEKYAVRTPFLKVKGEGYEEFPEENESVIKNAAPFTFKSKTEAGLTDSR